VDNQKRISDRVSGFTGKDDFNGRCEKLVELGAWQFLYDAHTGKLPEPGRSPQAVIVSTLHLEPYTASSRSMLANNVGSFIDGLEQLQSLLEYQPIYLGVSDPKSELANELRRALRGHAWVKFVAMPRKYPNDNFAVLARHLELKADAAEPVWALRTEGVLAVNEAMSQSQPCTSRLISIAGPVVKSPRHLKVMVGYPLDKILAEIASVKAVRVINGGVLTGTIIGEDQRGLDAECQGLTILEDEPQREFLSFVRSGVGNRSYSKCFLSALRKPFNEAFDTSQRGELRPCIDCGYCEEVCPVGIMPHLIHKYLYQDELEEAVRAGLNRCVLCGLCSFVCTSKINLKEQFRVAQETVVSEQLSVDSERLVVK